MKKINMIKITRINIFNLKTNNNFIIENKRSIYYEKIKLRRTSGEKIVYSINMCSHVSA